MNIFYEVAGEGPPLVLIHANPFDHAMWLYQIATFSRLFGVVAVDLRGYGRSDKPEQPFTFSDMANDVVAVVRDQGFDRIALAGVSIGATLALQIVLDHPQLAKAAILVGGESGNPVIFGSLAADYASISITEQRRRHVEMIITAQFAKSAVGQYLIDAVLENTPRLSGKSISQIFRARSSVNLQSRLASVSAPTLVINGENDVSLESGRYTAAHIPKCGAPDDLRCWPHVLYREPAGIRSAGSRLSVDKGLWT
ncbi:MAG: alpha/beta fold hydrolase, partial [Alphaproteobacteria bacterium]